MNRFAAACLVGLALSPSARADAYGPYDLTRLVVSTTTPAGPEQSLDGAYLDSMLGDLARHAENYPPRFDNDLDRKRATNDIIGLARLLDILVKAPNPDPELLQRDAFVYSVAHNLNLQGAAERADALYRQVLAIQPGNAAVSYRYGVFLAGAGKPADAKPLLEQAQKGGIAEANYSLGMVLLALGDRPAALRYLQAWQRKNPTDPDIAKIIDGVKSGKGEMRTMK